MPYVSTSGPPLLYSSPFSPLPPMLHWDTHSRLPRSVHSLINLVHVYAPEIHVRNMYYYVCRAAAQSMVNFSVYTVEPPYCGQPLGPHEVS